MRIDLENEESLNLTLMESTFHKKIISASIESKQNYFQAEFLIPIDTSLLL